MFSIGNSVFKIKSVESGVRVLENNVESTYNSIGELLIHIYEDYVLTRQEEINMILELRHLGFRL